MQLTRGWASNSPARSTWLSELQPGSALLAVLGGMGAHSHVSCGTKPVLVPPLAGTINVYLQYEGSPAWHRVWSAKGQQSTGWQRMTMETFRMQRLQVKPLGLSLKL